MTQQPRHGVGLVDRVGITCLCEWTTTFGSGGWLRFNEHLAEAAAPDPAERIVAAAQEWEATTDFAERDFGDQRLLLALAYAVAQDDGRAGDAGPDLSTAAPDSVASPADDWVICQTCEGDGGWPTSAAPVPLDHGYSPRPDWAGTCPRCGAKAGDNCAVLTDPVASPPPLNVERLARAIHVSAPETHHRRKCIDRHDLRAADIAAEYARLEGQPAAEEPR